MKWRLWLFIIRGRSFHIGKIIIMKRHVERPIWHSILGNESRAARAEAARGMSPEELLFISEPDADDISDYGGEVEDYCRDLGVDLSDFYGTHAENFSEGLDFPGFDGSEDMSDFQDDGDFIG